MEEPTAAAIEKVTLSELLANNNNVGSAEELKPREKARFALAAWVLAGLAFLFILASIALICSPDSRNEEANAIFDFVSTFAPPIATLVIGFYFNNENAR